MNKERNELEDLPTPVIQKNENQIITKVLYNDGM